MKKGFLLPILALGAGAVAYVLAKKYDEQKEELEETFVEIVDDEETEDTLVELAEEEETECCCEKTEECCEETECCCEETECCCEKTEGCCEEATEEVVAVAKEL